MRSCVARLLSAAILLGVLFIAGQPTAVAAVPSLMSVQGKLTDAIGDPWPAGPKTFTFKIFDAVVGGAEIWPAGPGESQVVNTDAAGLWAAQLGTVTPLMDAVFNGTDRWLEVTVNDGVNPPETLTRMKLNTNPYTYRASTVDGAAGGTITSKVSIGPGHANTGANAFVAGANNVASGDQSVVCGGDFNAALGGHSTVGGGGTNTAQGGHATVGGGFTNDATGMMATVGGGSANQSTANASAVSGGASNVAGADFSVIAGGWLNVASGEGAFVGGGIRNKARGTLAVIGGGGGPDLLGADSNSAPGDYAVVGGGKGNRAAARNAVVAGGQYNLASGDNSLVSGGTANEARAVEAIVGGGSSNVASGIGSVIDGGAGNIASGLLATISGGFYNRARGQYAVVGGGGGESSSDSNTASGDWSTVSGGRQNVADEIIATIGGGRQNIASGQGTSIGGGVGNVITGNYSTIPGGYDNQVAGSNSFAGGLHARADHDGCFVWADAIAPQFPSSTGNEFSVRCRGGARFVSAIDGIGNPTAGVQLAAGGGSWSSISDRNVKENVTPVDGLALLAKLAAIPVATWNYKSQPAVIRHIGPMAQDFHAAFGVGEDDKHITTIDADGVALAAIQELKRQLDERSSEVKDLKALVEKLSKHVDELSHAKCEKRREDQ